MSYFNPKVYNKQNLKEKDRNELEYWNERFNGVIDNAKDDFFNSGCPTFDNMRQEIIDDFCKRLKTLLGFEMQENVVGIIDHYDEEPEEIEEYETFLYNDDEDDE